MELHRALYTAALLVTVVTLSGCALPPILGGDQRPAPVEGGDPASTGATPSTESRTGPGAGLAPQTNQRSAIRHTLTPRHRGPMVCGDDDWSIRLAAAAEEAGLSPNMRIGFPLADHTGQLSQPLRDTWGDPRRYRGGIHYGVDMFVPAGRKVVSMTAGQVVYVRPSRRKPGGNIVFVRDRTGHRWGYMHLSQFAPGIKPGRKVTVGTLLGYTGRTGLRASSTHLHVDVRRRVPSGTGKDGHQWRAVAQKPGRGYDNEYVNMFQLINALNQRRLEREGVIPTRSC